MQLILSPQQSARRHPLLVFALLACLTWATMGHLSWAEEEIRSFMSDVTVEANGDLQVTETLEVQGEGNRIHHGIYRDFPTEYRDSNGNPFLVGFEVISARRDGRPEPFHTQSKDNGQRVYLGSQETTLSPGIYTYELTYKTTRQLGYFKDHDELYWNVTGNGWIFPILQAQAKIRVHGLAPQQVLWQRGFTGFQGSHETAYQYAVKDGVPTFWSTRPLGSNEGLTIVLAWPKGIIQEPSDAQKTLWAFLDALPVIASFFGLLILAGYYGILWLRVGKDPDSGVVMPLYHPPHNLSPAALRYVLKMGSDPVCLSAAFLNLAVHGYVHIEEEKPAFSFSKSYILSRAETQDYGHLSPEELSLQQTFYHHVGEGERLEMTNTHYTTFQALQNTLDGALQRGYRDNYFKLNRGYAIGGIVLSLLLLLPAAISFQQHELAWVLLFFLAIWTSIATCLCLSVIPKFKAWQQSPSWKKLFSFLIMAIIAGAFSLSTVFPLYGLATVSSWMLAPLVPPYFVLNVLFFELLKARTPAGQKLYDQIQGFKLYLSIAEQEELDYKMSKEEITPEMFERFLPYAVALGVENAWASRFNRSLERMGQPPATPHYAWYSGSGNFNSMSHFASGFSSGFSQAISSSSSPPGSSSGGGGGGSSGGGGGGGGGGGW